MRAFGFSIMRWLEMSDTSCALGRAPYRTRRTGPRHPLQLLIGNVRDAAALSAHPFHLSPKGEWSGNEASR